MTGKLIGGIIALLTTALATMAIWNTALRNDNQRLAGDNQRLNAELAEIAERAEKTAAEMLKLTAKAAALQKAGRKGEDKINAEIRKGGDPCLNSRPDGAMLDLLRNGVPDHQE